MHSLKNTRKLILIFIFAVIFSCEQQEGIAPSSGKSSPVEEVKRSGSPHLDELITHFEKQDLPNARNRSVLGQVDFDTAVKIYDSVHRVTNYTFSVAEEKVLTLQNFIISEHDDGQLTGKLYTHKIDEDWMAELDTFPGWEHFTGTYIIQNLEGDVLLEKKIVDGISVSESSTNGRTSGNNCTTVYTRVCHSWTTSVEGYAYQGSGSDCWMETQTICYNSNGSGSGGGVTGFPTRGEPKPKREVLVPDDDFSSYGVSGGSGSSSISAIERLENKLKDNPNALISDIPCEELKKWKNIASKKAGNDVISRLETLNRQYNVWNNFEIQKLEDANGVTINMDYFPITIDKLPSGMTAKSLFKEIRLNINDFIDPTKANFEPFSDKEAEIWESSDPVSAIIHIDMGNNTTPIRGYWPGQPDDGSVVCIESSASHWVFSTIQAPGDWRHPVSGNRQFGYFRNSNGSYTFYTRGVDRATSKLDNWIQEEYNKIFEEADALWSSFQKQITDYVNQKEGKAKVNNPVIGRPNWDDIKDYLEGRKSINEIGCKN